MFLALALACVWPTIVRAESEDGPIALVIPIDDPTLPAEQVRRAIASELKRGVMDPSAGASVGSVVITVASDSAEDGRRATVRFTDSEGRSVTRTIALPPEPERAVEAVALLVGNLVRDEAGALLASLAPKEAHEPTTDGEPAPPEEESEVGQASAGPGLEAPSDAASIGTPKKRWSPRDAVALNLSLFHPIALRSDAEHISADVELGLAYSRIGQVGGLGFNLFVLRVEHDLTGFGYGSLWASAGGDMDGFMLSGLVSHVGGAVEGVQLAGLVALAGPVDGVQVAPAVALADGDVDGVQLGVVSVAGDVDGVQLGAVSVAGDVDGVQLGAVSVAGDVDGAQIGLVNVAGKVRGTQIGLINVADELKGMPIGLVNLNGRIQPTVWTTTTTPVNAGVMFRGRPGYTLVHGGWDPDGNRQQLGAALGVGWPVGDFFFDGDVGYAGEWDGDLFGEVDRHVIRYRLTAGVRPTSGLSFFAGGGLRHDIELGPTSTYRPEFHLGVQAF